MWYQSWNSFGEIVFVERWPESQAHPTLSLYAFWCLGEWVIY